MLYSAHKSSWFTLAVFLTIHLLDCIVFHTVKTLKGLNYVQEYYLLTILYALLSVKMDS